VDDASEIAMNQTDQILAYLKAGFAITPMDALERVGCFRLAPRILELRMAERAAA